MLWIGSEGLQIGCQTCMTFACCIAWGGDLHAFEGQDMKLKEIAIRCLMILMLAYRRHMLWKGQRLGFCARPGPIDPSLAVRFLGREPSPLKYEFSDITSMFEFDIEIMFMFANLSCLSMYCKSFTFLYNLHAHFTSSLVFSKISVHAAPSRLRIFCWAPFKYLDGWAVQHVTLLPWMSVGGEDSSKDPTEIRLKHNIMHRECKRWWRNKSIAM